MTNGCKFRNGLIRAMATSLRIRIFWTFLGIVLVATCFITLLRMPSTKSTILKPIHYFGYYMQQSTQLTKNYTILWMNLPFFIQARWDIKLCGFKECEFKNCRMTFNRKETNISDAVIFDGIFVGPKVSFERPLGQVWIFAEHESPNYYSSSGRRMWWKRPPWSRSFNWTMTYDLSTTDIYLPYGELRERSTWPARNYTNIALNKHADIVIVTSHCQTQSKRESFISKLNKLIPVKTLGSCGEKWNCGKRLVHDDCFQILNTTYRFYLAFENALCSQYFTEKYFENFNYDVILVTRGGRSSDAADILPKGTYISTDDFESIESLAKYLKKVSRSVKQYAELLRKKDRYYSVGYKVVYQRAMCDICKRMNNQDKYRQTIADMYNRTYDSKPCREPDDIK